MKILYVARHDPQDNQDELAIGHALEQLGHEVTRVHELRRHRTEPLKDTGRFDFCLFHKWATVSEIAELRCPAAFWYFDMIRPIDGDATLSARSDSRVNWMRDVLALPNVVAGFCTDGDWVADDPHRSGKLRWLMQGADERYVGFGTADPNYSGPEILFTGMINHGARRASHVAHLRARYGDRFGVLGDGGPKYRRHGRALADIFASTSVVVAPDGPNTDRYWSNRAYLSLGLGAYLLHPRCEGLLSHYRPEELTYYDTWAHLDKLIDYALGLPSEFRKMTAKRGLDRTMESNLYRHRCVDLVRQVQWLIDPIGQTKGDDA